MAPKKDPNSPVSILEKLKLFLIVHWRGILTLIIPLSTCFMVFTSKEKYMWVAYILIIMGLFWVTECIPLAVTGFIPVMVLPLAGVSSTNEVCRAYVNDTIFMFLGSLFLAASVEQSGVHVRLAYFAIRTIGYSHMKLLAAMCTVTCFVSMWIVNTAATTMVVPINFALLKVFETEGCLKIYDKTKDGDDVASDYTTCYLCSATYSATIGGIGTLVGTGTNLAFKGLFVETFPAAPDYLSFLKFSAFAVPYMILMEGAMYLWLIIVYFGFLRPRSKVAKQSRIPKTARDAARKRIEKDSAALGPIRFWEMMVVILFGSTIVLFFLRSPGLFWGWGDVISNYWLGKPSPKFITDSALCMIAVFIMVLLPNELSFFKNLTAKYKEQMPSKSIGSVLDWPTTNRMTPFGFTFLLGGGFALSTSASTSGLNTALGDILRSSLEKLPGPLVLFIVIFTVIFVTNFASNVAVANVFVPIAMELARKLTINPLYYNIAAGFSASYCFMLPVGTPGNLVVQAAANIPTGKMMKAGFGPTVATLFLTWGAVYVWAPVIWPELKIGKPSWLE